MHASYADLEKKLELARQSVTVGALYRHYRDSAKRYKVIAVALQEDTETPCVVYQSLQATDLFWVRNLDDWLALVPQADGSRVPRFEPVSE